MRDIHSHILPGVDDGAPDIKASLEMLEAAKAAGVTSIVCTPHCREPFFDYAAMNEAFRELTAAAPDFPFTMGFEVNHSKLMDLGPLGPSCFLLTEGQPLHEYNIYEQRLDLPTKQKPPMADSSALRVAALLLSPLLILSYYFDCF